MAIDRKKFIEAVLANNTAVVKQLIDAENDTREIQTFWNSHGSSPLKYVCSLEMALLLLEAHFDVPLVVIDELKKYYNEKDRDELIKFLTLLRNILTSPTKEMARKLISERSSAMHPAAPRAEPAAPPEVKARTIPTAMPATPPTTTDIIDEEQLRPFIDTIKTANDSWAKAISENYKENDKLDRLCLAVEWYAYALRIMPKKFSKKALEEYLLNEHGVEFATNSIFRRLKQIIDGLVPAPIAIQCKAYIALASVYSNETESTNNELKTLLAQLNKQPGPVWKSWQKYIAGWNLKEGWLVTQNLEDSLKIFNSFKVGEEPYVLTKFAAAEIYIAQNTEFSYAQAIKAYQEAYKAATNNLQRKQCLQCLEKIKLSSPNMTVAVNVVLVHCYLQEAAHPTPLKKPELILQDAKTLVSAAVAHPPSVIKKNYVALTEAKCNDDVVNEFINIVVANIREQRVVQDILEPNIFVLQYATDYFIKNNDAVMACEYCERQIHYLVNNSISVAEITAKLLDQIDKINRALGTTRNTDTLTKMLASLETDLYAHFCQHNPVHLKVKLAFIIAWAHEKVAELAPSQSQFRQREASRYYGEIVNEYLKHKFEDQASLSLFATTKDILVKYTKIKITAPISGKHKKAPQIANELLGKLQERADSDYIKTLEKNLEAPDAKKLTRENAHNLQNLCLIRPLVDEKAEPTDVKTEPNHVQATKVLALAYATAKMPDGDDETQRQTALKLVLELGDCNRKTIQRLYDYYKPISERIFFAKHTDRALICAFYLSDKKFIDDMYSKDRERPLIIFLHNKIKPGDDKPFARLIADLSNPLTTPDEEFAKVGPVFTKLGFDTDRLRKAGSRAVSVPVSTPAPPAIARWPKPGAPSAPPVDELTRVGISTGAPSISGAPSSSATVMGGRPPDLTNLSRP